MNPIPFADDPDRGKPISLATGDVEGLDPGQWLSTSVVDYVMQTSLAASFPQLATIRIFYRRHHFRQSSTKRFPNISESANSMFERERSRNWLEAIHGILKKMSLRIHASRKKYERKTGVVETVYSQILDGWEKGVGYRVVDSGGDGQKYSVHWIIEGNTGSNQSFTLYWVDGVCECGGWQMHGVPCVHGMAYFRWRNDWTLQQVVEQFVEKCHTYDHEQKLYSGSFVPVCMDMLQPDQTTLLPDVEGKRMAGRPKTVRVWLRSRYSHQPEKSPIVYSRCHQRSHNAGTCQGRAALAKKTNADTAQNSNSVL
ncbi:hypothetical protein IV203_024165 [Nitzschia inconspicua]|uniref:SWIM-type domain-containing protein n=1 Tax=Nitzschia inconspicua TaxID=303405 RepID=A0A9K3KBB7_9STRA|nr:hypothetical protein IV203_024165 [Nitzschia inconspicua]